MPMRRLFSLFTSLMLVVAWTTLSQGGVDDKKDDKKPKNHIVEMHDNSFKPKEIKIAVGDTITWVNKGDHTHNAVSNDKGKTFDTRAVKAGAKSKPITFKKTGSFPYVCTYHEDDDMKGTILVK
jgi:plastocyanin